MTDSIYGPGWAAPPSTGSKDVTLTLKYPVSFSQRASCSGSFQYTREDMR